MRNRNQGRRYERDMGDDFYGTDNGYRRYQRDDAYGERGNDYYGSYGSDRDSYASRDSGQRYGNDRDMRDYGGGYGQRSHYYGSAQSYVPENRPSEMRDWGRSSQDSRYAMGSDNDRYGRMNRDYDSYGSSYGSGRSFRSDDDYRSYGSRDRDYGSRFDESSNDRGFLERAGDEVRSWFGDDDAQRRRQRDHRYDDSSYGSDYGSQGRSYSSSSASYGAGRYSDNDYGSSSYGSRDASGDYRPGASHSGRGPKGYTRSDDRIRDDICETLTRDPRVDASGLEVSVNNGEVTLTGSVNERSAKRRAEDCAERVSGVSHVQNNLRVDNSASNQQSSTGMTGSASGDAGSTTTGTSGMTGTSSTSATTGSTSTGATSTKSTS